MSYINHKAWDNTLNYQTFTSHDNQFHNLIQVKSDTQVYSCIMEKVTELPQYIIPNELSWQRYSHMVIQEKKVSKRMLTFTDHGRQICLLSWNPHISKSLTPLSLFEAMKCTAPLRQCKFKQMWKIRHCLGTDKIIINERRKARKKEKTT